MCANKLLRTVKCQMHTPTFFCHPKTQAVFTVLPTVVGIMAKVFVLKMSNTELASTGMKLTEDMTTTFSQHWYYIKPDNAFF